MDILIGQSISSQETFSVISISFDLNPRCCATELSRHVEAGGAGTPTFCLFYFGYFAIGNLCLSYVYTKETYFSDAATGPRRPLLCVNRRTPLQNQDTPISSVCSMPRSEKHPLPLMLERRNLSLLSSWPTSLLVKKPP